jgi:hypothetical protein
LGLASIGRGEQALVGGRQQRVVRRPARDQIRDGGRRFVGIELDRARSVWAERGHIKEASRLKDGSDDQLDPVLKRAAHDPCVVDAQERVVLGSGQGPAVRAPTKIGDELVGARFVLRAAR